MLTLRVLTKSGPKPGPNTDILVYRLILCNPMLTRRETSDADNRDRNEREKSLEEFT